MNRHKHSIAILGAACRFPAASSLDDLATILFEGRDAVREDVARRRWINQRYWHPRKRSPGHTYTLMAGLIDNVSAFDPDLTGMSVREASQTDPQQLLLLELTHEALEDAGIPIDRVSGQRVGVFVGVSLSDYMNIRAGDLATADGYFVTGGAKSVVANRISHAFDFHGPSLMTDTACSSSLVVLDMARHALERGEIDTAIVGASNLLLDPRTFVGFAQATMLSPTGRSRPFSAQADGFMRAEGAGILVLRRQQDVRPDDRPLGWVLGTGVNSDGNTVGLALPNGDAQAALLREVYDRAGIAPETLDYFEAHGTGTPIGDPIETAAIGAVLGQSRDGALPIGSAKSSFGHLETASGMVGLFSALAVLRHRRTPRLAHFEAPNPAIDFAGLNLEPCAESLPLKPAGRLTVGVNSFGFGGTNGHAILSDEPAAPSRTSRRPKRTRPRALPLLLSARTEAALTDAARDWANYLDTLAPETVAEAVRGAARSRTHYQHRLAVRGGSAAEMAHDLRAWLDEPSGTAVRTGEAAPGGIVFAFSGNGSQWPGMAKQALARNADFRAAIRRLDRAMTPRLGWSVEAELKRGDADRLRGTDVAQPLLFAVQYALVEALGVWGIRPSATIGHSVGEIASAWCAGAISLETAIDVVVCRSELQHRTRGLGRMMVCQLDAAEAERRIAALGLGLEIGAFNRSNSLTLTGSEPDILRFAAALEADKLQARVLDLDYAFHSRLLDPLRHEMLDRLAGTHGTAPRIDFYSTVSGRLEPNPVLDAEYWWRNLRDPVRFSDAVAALAKTDTGLFVEIGPHPVLTSALGPVREGHDGVRHVVHSLHRLHGMGDPIEAIVRQYHCLGACIAGSARYNGPRRARELPHYPYQRRTLDLPSTPEGFTQDHVVAPHPLLGLPTGDGMLEWRSFVDLALHPWLADHVVDGEVFLPATAMIDMAIAAARVRSPEAEAIEILDLDIFSPISIERDTTRELRFAIEPARNRFEIASRPRLQDVPWTRHATGRVSAISPPPDRRIEIPARIVEHWDIDALYAHGQDLGLHYGPTFRLAETVVLHADLQASIHLSAPDAAVAARAAAGSAIDPIRFDAVFHALLAVKTAYPDKRVPRRFGRLRAFVRPGSPPAMGLFSVLREGPTASLTHIQVADGSGHILVEMEDAWFMHSLVPASHEPPRFWGVQRVPVAPAKIGSGAAPAVAAPAEQSETALLFEAAVAGGIAAAMETFGHGRPILPETLVAEGRLEPENQAFLEGLLAALTAAGFATRKSTGWRLDPSNQELADWTDIWRSLQFELPAAAAEVALAGAALVQLGDVLAGRAARIPPADSLLTQAIADGPDGQALIDRLADAAASGIASAIAAVPDGRRIEVLDIGGSAGAVTDRLAQRLLADGATLPTGLRLTVAAGSSEHTERAQAALSRVPGQATVWTPGHPLPATLAERRFDLIVVGQPFAAGLTPADLPAELVPLLAPGARLLIGEAAPSPFWSLLLPSGSAPNHPDTWAEAASAHGLRPSAAETHRGMVWDSVVRAIDVPTVAPESAMPTAPTLIVDAGDPALAAHLEDALYLAGDTVVTVGADRLAEAMDTHRGDIVLLAGDPADPVRTLSLLATLRAQIGEDASGRLVVATKGEAEGEDTAQAIEASVRVMGNETPGLTWRTLRLSRHLDRDAAKDAIVAALTAEDNEAEQWIGTADTAAPRIRELPVATDTDSPAKLDVARRGRVDGLDWVPIDLSIPTGDRVLIEVEAAGLNFRDLMWTLGLLPDEALIDGFAGTTVGLECAGRVVAVGPDVTRFAPGDRVMALAPAALATHATTVEAACLRIPDGLPAEAATTIPVAYMTAIHALGALAHLAAGETVLIHGAAGGVGLAALQYAQHRGARVFATAGSPAKRDYLCLLGAEAVFDSRSLAFADEIRRLTDGRGVDVVLNSLSGRAMELSLETIAPLGRFVELGKRDFFADTAVGLRPMRRNVAYFGVDIDQLALHRPRAMADLFAEIGQLLDQGAIGPLPYRAVGFGQATDVLRQMRDGGHIGKLVLSHARGGAAPRRAIAPFAADPAGTYVLTGGLSGFGLETARWLVARGARHLALLGRRGAETPGAAEAIAAFAAVGCRAVAHVCDVADRGRLAATLRTIRDTQPPIVGVVHAATVLRDGMLAEMDAAAFQDVLAAKYRGAVWLDELTAGDPVALFLVYSSVSTLLGNPGQANYVAANAGIEALIERRRARGKPGIAIAWGPIADSGILTRAGAAAETVARRVGGSLLKTSDALASLDRVLHENLALVAVAVVRWSDARGTLRGIATARFADVLGPIGTEETRGPADIRDAVAHLPTDAALALVQDTLIATLSDVLRLPTDKIRGTTRVADIGLDSLLGVELALAIEARFKVSLGRAAIAGQPTVGHLAATVLRALGPTEAAADGNSDNTLIEIALRYEGEAALAPHS